MPQSFRIAEKKCHQIEKNTLQPSKINKIKFTSIRAIRKFQNIKKKRAKKGKEKFPRRNDNQFTANSSATRDEKNREYLQSMVVKSRILYPN